MIVDLIGLLLAGPTPRAGASEKKTKTEKAQREERQKIREQVRSADPEKLLQAVKKCDGHTIFISYNAGGTTAACPGGCPETNAFGPSNYSNAAFSPYLDLQTEAVGL